MRMHSLEPKETIELLEGILLTRNILYGLNGDGNFFQRVYSFLRGNNNQQLRYEDDEECLENAHRRMQEYTEREQQKTHRALERIYGMERAQELFNKFYKLKQAKAF